MRNDVEGVQPLDGNYYYLEARPLISIHGLKMNTHSTTGQSQLQCYPELNSLMKWDDVDNMQVKFEVNIPNDWTGFVITGIFYR